MIIDDAILELRWYKEVDLDQLVALHDECFSREAWERADFGKFMAGGRRRRNNVIKSLVDSAGRLYGALLYTMEAQQCRIRRVSVFDQYRRNGLATFMLNALCGPRSPIRRKVFTTRVRETNTSMLLLLKNRMGFTFDPMRTRESDGGVEFYEFTFIKDAVPA